MTVHGEVGRTSVAGPHGVVLDETRVALPDLAGWIDQAAGEVSYLLVLADREGAHLDLHTASRPAEQQSRSSPGGVPTASRRMRCGPTSTSCSPATPRAPSTTCSTRSCGPRSTAW